MQLRMAVTAATAVVLASAAACSSSSSPKSSTSSAASPSTVTTSPSGSSGSSTTAPRTTSVDWPTYYGDVRRDGVSTAGPRTDGRFHRAWASSRLDGDVYAQPLVVGSRVIVATADDSVYALSLASGKVEWQRHVGTPVPSSSLPCGNVDPVGITGTPVVDAAAGRVYAVGMVQPMHHELFALDLATGRVIASQRVDASGSDPAVENQRGALALANGAVYVPFGGRYGDCGDYHGAVTSVAVTTNGLGAVHSYTLPTQREGGFWSPAGPAFEPDGSFFIASGNSSSNGRYDYGNTLVHLSATLQLVDSFAPTNWIALNEGDVDIGSTSPALLSNGRIFQIGKSGTGYVLDAAHLGGIGGELTSTKVCPSQAFGSVAHRTNAVYVPCNDALVAMDAGGSSLSRTWSASISLPGPAVIDGSLLWLLGTENGDLIALDAASGHQVFSLHLDSVPSRFTSPALGGGDVIAAANRTVYAISG